MLADILRYAQSLGAVYGTETRSLFLYSIVRMHRPRRLLELGTGTGATTFMMAQGLKENGEGHLWTVDDGQHWEQVRTHADTAFPGAAGQSHEQFVKARTRDFDLAAQLTLLPRTLPPFPPEPDGAIDLLFSDFRHDPTGVTDLIGHYLPRMAPASSIFIDWPRRSCPATCCSRPWRGNWARVACRAHCSGAKTRPP